MTDEYSVGLSNNDGSPMSMDDLRTLVDQLRVGLQTRQLIGTAVGILMEREGVDQAAAFRMLVAASQNQNTKVRDVSEQVVSKAERRISRRT